MPLHAMPPLFDPSSATRFRAVRITVAIFVIAARGVAAAPFASDSELVDHVIELMDRRLALMPEIAALKFREHRPIEDPARERQVLTHSVADAAAIHLDAHAARTFFAVQIEMARAVQEELFRRWRAGDGQPPPARDLATLLRPELDQIGQALLAAVYLACHALSDTPEPALRDRTSRLGRYPGITDLALDEISHALRALRLTAPATWTTLERVGVLRIGTTGDYAPFSDDRAATLQGLDIELALSLARSWRVRPVFIRTSWPTLMEDLRQNRFDIAASGISVTAERSRVASFSVPYFFDGKTPIARRPQADRFGSLEAIDQPGVRVIVNPGGTNERFARDNLRRATILLHPDNRTIFAEIVADRADVMITDGIEVRLQERRHSELKGTRTEPFTRAGKAFLLARDSDLTPRVNGWLERRIEAGEIQELLDEALSAAARNHRN